ncbi:MAG TPA: hypothetical protein VI146_05450 [Nitrososphaeraceae archaeon]
MHANFDIPRVLQTMMWLFSKHLWKKRRGTVAHEVIIGSGI